MIENGIRWLYIQNFIHYSYIEIYKIKAIKNISKILY